MARKISKKISRLAPPKVAASKDATVPVLAHVLGTITGFIGALIILLVTDDEYAKKHARRALNWQLSLLIYYTISIVLILILVGILLLILLAILNIIFCIIAAVKASNRELYDYPMTIQFLKDK